MTVEELANKRYGGEFVFMFGHLEGRFYKVFDVMRFKIAEFKGWTILGIPASLDDHRPGSKTVIFIEGKANEADFMII